MSDVGRNMTDINKGSSPGDNAKTAAYTLLWVFAMALVGIGISVWLLV